MYDRLRGEVAELSPASVVLDVGGVFYEAAIPLSTFNSLKGKAQTVLFTHLYVREDALRLFGFATADERRLFRLVLDVNGVGPSIGLACLSLLSPEETVEALAEGSVKTLQRVKGVGRKVAERMALELKERAAAMQAASHAAAEPDAASGFGAIQASGKAEEAVEALVELGFQRRTAVQRVAAALDSDPGLAVEALIKTCLRQR